MKTEPHKVLEPNKIPRGVRGVVILYFFSTGCLVLMSIFIFIMNLNDAGGILASILLFLFAGLHLLLAIKLRQGRNWARITILTFTWISGLAGIMTIVIPIIAGIIINTLQFEKINVVYFTKEPYYKEAPANRQLRDEVERLKYHTEKLKLEKEIEKIKKKQ